jgi:hypothetical protein
MVHAVPIMLHIYSGYIIFVLVRHLFGTGEQSRWNDTIQDS